MGCAGSKPTPIPGHLELLGCCWEADHSQADQTGFSTGGAYYPYDPQDPGRRDCHAFRINADDNPALMTSNSAYLADHNLSVGPGVSCVNCRSVNTTSISDSTIKQCTTTGVGIRAHGSLSYVSLGGELARAKEAGPGSSMSLTLVVVQCHQVSMDPSQHAKYKYERTPVDTNSVKNQARVLYGEGVVTNVIYGGYLVIDTSQENYAAMQRGFAIRGDVQLGAGGGGIDVGFANTKIEGAKSTNFNIRCYGGKNIGNKFTNCPIEKILAMVDDWANDLLKNRHKAMPIAFRLQAYSGIGNHVLKLGSDWEDTRPKVAAPAATVTRFDDRTEAEATAGSESDADGRAQQDAEEDVYARIAARRQAAAASQPLEESSHTPFVRSDTATMFTSSSSPSLGLAAEGDGTQDESKAGTGARKPAAVSPRAKDNPNRPQIVIPGSPLKQPAAPAAAAAEATTASDDGMQRYTSAEEADDAEADRLLALEEYHAVCREVRDAEVATAAAQRQLAAAETKTARLFKAFLPAPPPASPTASAALAKQRVTLLHLLATSLGIVPTPTSTAALGSSASAAALVPSASGKVAAPLSAKTRDVKLGMEHVACTAALVTHPKCAARILQISSEFGHAIGDGDACVIAALMGHAHAASVRDLYVVQHKLGPKGAAALMEVSVRQHVARRNAPLSDANASFGGAACGGMSALWLEANDVWVPSEDSAALTQAMAVCQATEGFRVYVDKRR